MLMKMFTGPIGSGGVEQTHTFSVAGVVRLLRLNIHINSRKRPNYPKHHTPKFVCVCLLYYTEMAKENGNGKCPKRYI